VAFDPRQGWSPPPTGLDPDAAAVSEPGYDRRGLDRVSRIDRDPPAEPEAARAPLPAEAEPESVVDPPLDASPSRPGVDDDADRVDEGTGGALLGALGIAVVLGVLGAAWLLAGTDGAAPTPAEPPTVQTGNVAPVPDQPEPVEAAEAVRAPEAPSAEPIPDAAAPAVAAPADAGVADAQPDASWNPDETFDPVDVTDADELGRPPHGMVAVPAGLVHTGLAEPQRAAAEARCLEDLADYPKAWCAERLASTVEPAGPPRPVGPLFADLLEVSQAQYGDCVATGACEALRLHWDLKTQPATGLTRDMAAAYCTWRDARLPTADEWLYVARGGDQRLYPWGDEPPGTGRDARANYGRFTHKGGLPDRADRNKYASPVDTFGGPGASPFGARDMAGNVREWTTTEVDGQGITMGGGWREAPFELRVTRREPTPLGTVRNDLGFRCVADPAGSGEPRGAGEERK